MTTVWSKHTFSMHWETKKLLWLSLLCVFTLLWWSGTKFAVSLRSACKWRGSSCLGIGKLVLSKWWFSPKLIYKLTVRAKSQQALLFFLDFDKFVLKFTWKPKGPGIDKRVNRKGEQKLEDLHYLISKAYCKAVVIKALWHCYRERHIDQWNRTSSPQLNLFFYLFIWLHWVLVVAHRIFVASCRVSHCGLQTLAARVGSRARGYQWLWYLDSLVVARGLWSASSVVAACELSCFVACGS